MASPFIDLTEDSPPNSANRGIDGGSLTQLHALDNPNFVSRRHLGSTPSRAERLREDVIDVDALPPRSILRSNNADSRWPRRPEASVQFLDLPRSRPEDPGMIPMMPDFLQFHGPEVRPPVERAGRQLPPLPPRNVATHDAVDDIATVVQVFGGSFSRLLDPSSNPAPWENLEAAIEAERNYPSALAEASGPVRIQELQRALATRHRRVLSLHHHAYSPVSNMPHDLNYEAVPIWAQRHHMNGHYDNIPEHELRIAIAQSLRSDPLENREESVIQTTIEPPKACAEGYGRTSGDQEWVCVECGHELGSGNRCGGSSNGDNDTEDADMDGNPLSREAAEEQSLQQKRTFICKAGHVYCGSCAKKHMDYVRDERNRKHKPSRFCVAKGCRKVINTDEGRKIYMIELYQ